MNKIFSLTAIFALFFSLSIFAQSMDSGVIIQELTEIKADDPQMASSLSMLKGSSNSIYFKDNQVVTKMDMMGGMMKMETSMNSKSKTGFMLFNMEMMGMKYKVNITEEDAAKSKENAASMEVTYDKSDTKEIAGFKCHKATISSPDLQGGSVVAYVTEELKITADVIQGVDGNTITGFPLEYTISGPGMTMVYTTTELKKDVSAADLELKVDGYEEMSMDEFQKKMAAMGGGMGF